MRTKVRTLNNIIQVRTLQADQKYSVHTPIVSNVAVVLFWPGIPRGVVSPITDQCVSLSDQVALRMYM